MARFLSAPAEALSSAADASPPAPAWRYGTGTFDRSLRRVLDFQEFGSWTGERWQPGPSYPDARSGLLRLTRTGGQPGIARGQAAIRALDRTVGRDGRRLRHPPPRRAGRGWRGGCDRRESPGHPGELERA